MDTPRSPEPGSSVDWPDAGAWAAAWLAEASGAAEPTDDRVGPAHDHLDGRHDDDPDALVAPTSGAASPGR